MTSAELQVLFEDNHVLVVLKPAGMLTQGDKTGDLSVLALAKQWLIDKYQKSGNAYVGMMHRLDRPVGGVLVFAKTSKAANRLTMQFRAKTVQKLYLAVMTGHLPDSSGSLTHYIRKRPGNRRVQIAPTPFADAKCAELSYVVSAETPAYTLAQVRIQTGRHHQIRAQFAAIGHPLLGDKKYGSREMLPQGNLALFAAQIVFAHPITQAEISICAPLPREWPWDLFRTLDAVA